MGHDPTKFLLGTTGSSAKEISSHASDPATFLAGLAVGLTSGGVLSLTALPRIGVSLGKSLSDHKQTAVARSGESIALLLTDAFTPVIGAQVHISDTTGKGIASGEGATGANATYISGVLTGITEAGSTANCALIDMPGGL